MKKLLIDCFLSTTLVFLVLLGVQRLTKLDWMNALDPISQALSDVELTDYSFSRLRIGDPEPDPNIVLVNISKLSRAEIAQQIRVISSFKPRVIALDMILSCDGGVYDTVNCPQRYDTLANLLFADAIKEAGSVVMGHKLWQSSQIKDPNILYYDSIEHTDADLRVNAYEGFVNLPTGADIQEDLKICRTVIPQMVVNGKREIAFSVKIAELFDKKKADAFLQRNYEEEIINYIGNGPDPYGASTFPNRFSVLDYDQALDPESFSPDLIKDKIIIMGFLGEDLSDRSWEDKFFTPLNKQIAGRARPDMYGVVIHANIVSMIISANFIDQLSEYQKIAIAFLLIFFNMALFWFIQRRFPIWFDTISLGLQIFQLLVFAILVPYVMDWYNFKLDITVAFAGLALAGPCFEIYMSILKDILKAFRKRLLTRRRKQVLTS
jgi:CHASE2 domain-containing sensor protein